MRCAVMCHVSMSSLSKYYLTVSPVDGSLFVSDYQQRRVVRLTTVNVHSRHEETAATASSVELVAGSGQTCVPGAQSQCGDGQLAIHAVLTHPKGAYHHHYRLIVAGHVGGSTSDSQMYSV